MAQTDADRMEEYKSKINRVAKQHNIDPSLIAAIISRESRAGAALTDGWGDWDTERGAYNAWGLMQVVLNYIVLLISLWRSLISISIGWC